MSDPAERLAAALGARPRALRRLAESFAGPVLAVDMPDGTRFAAKLSDGKVDLSVEAWMLETLARRSALPVPPVVHGAPELLVLGWIEHDGGGLGAHGCADLAQHVAALHGCAGARYGLERDTLIGPLAQPNPPGDDWPAFFRDHRLLHMAGVARDAGALPEPLHRRVLRLAERVENLLAPAAPPTLIHGDLWSGNLLLRGGRVAGFVDPACYYADPEIELAFGTLFGPFDRAFFDAYRTHRPIRDGFFEARRGLYLLYPLLVHVRLFGGGYVGQVERELARLDA